MKAASEIRLGLGIMLGMQALMTLGAIGALSRMSPAIERIITENEVSIEAVEDMLAALASPDAAQRRKDFEVALQKARDNVTEDEEKPLIEAIGNEGKAVLSGANTDSGSLVRSLRALSDVNRSSMHRADDRAKRLGAAGAWTAVLIGLASFLASAFVFRRISRRILAPIEELRSVIEARRERDPHRRIAMRAATADLQSVGDALNDLIETRKEEGGARSDMLAAERAALILLLDRSTEAVAVVDRSGRIAAANTACDILLSSATGPRLKAMLESVPSGQAPPHVRVEDARGQAWICFLGEMLALKDTIRPA